MMLPCPLAFVFFSVSKMARDEGLECFVARAPKKRETHRGARSAERRRDRRRHRRPTFSFFFFSLLPLVFQKPLHFFSIFFIFSFLDIQRCQRKNKQDQREKKKEGQQAAGEEAVMRDNQQFSQVRGFLPRPPPSPPSAPPPPPRFPAPPPPSPPPIPAGTALADTTPAGAPGPR